MSGTTNALQLQSIVANAETASIIIGAPGSYALSVVHTSLAATPQAALTVGTPAVALTPGQAALVQSAVNKANAAAIATPSAASGVEAAANTPITIITNLLKGLPLLLSAPEDIKKFEQGATATLHWWGWTLKMDEDSTKTFEKFLTTDIGGFAAIAAALSAISPPLAAAGAIISAVTTGLDGWVVGADTGKGVTINGYLWVGVYVTGN